MDACRAEHGREEPTLTSHPTFSSADDGLPKHEQSDSKLPRVQCGDKRSGTLRDEVIGRFST